MVLPNGYDPTRTYPVVLVFTGGPQQLRMAEGTLNTDWRQEAERRGYVVISPGTPDGSLFFEGADRVFPSFLDQILKDYHVRGGKLHVAGHSNGGLSAFHVAARYPQYFVTLIPFLAVAAIELVDLLGISTKVMDLRVLAVVAVLLVLPAGWSNKVPALAARWPPAELPMTPMRAGLILNSAARDRTIRTARSTSCSGAG